MKLIYTLSIAILVLGVTSFTIHNTSSIEPNERKERTFGDLSTDEKKEAIAHILSTGNCEWKGIKLYGKIKFVESFPDIKIKFVKSFPDIKVKFVSSFPDQCGKWKEVTSFPDFKVQVVNSFPDLKVQKVTSFPGMN